MLNDPIIGPTPDPPTREGGAVRFGCGLLFGVVLGFLAAWRTIYGRLGLCLAIGFGVGLLLGFMSMLKGDSVWFSVGKWFRRAVGGGRL